MTRKAPKNYMLLGTIEAQTIEKAISNGLNLVKNYKLEQVIFEQPAEVQATFARIKETFIKGEKTDVA